MYVIVRSLSIHPFMDYLPAERLPSQWKKWSVLYTKKKADFVCFSGTISKALLSEWQSLDTSTCSKSELYQVQGKGKYCGFVLISVIAHLLWLVLSQQQAYSSLLEQENGPVVMGMTEFIQRGLELEVSQ